MLVVLMTACFRLQPEIIGLATERDDSSKNRNKTDMANDYSPILRSVDFSP